MDELLLLVYWMIYNCLFGRCNVNVCMFATVTDIAKSLTVIQVFKSCKFVIIEIQIG